MQRKFRLSNAWSIILILILTSTSFLRIQAQNDSLKSIWQNDSFADSVRFGAIMEFYVHYSQSTPDSSLKLSGYHYQLAKQVGNRREEALALNEKAFVFYMLGYHADSINAVLLQVLSIYTETDNLLGIASTKNNIAALYEDQGDYQSAIHYYTEALILFEQQKEFKEVGIALNNIANIYSSIELYELALSNYKKSLNIYTEKGMDDEVGFLWLNMAVIYHKTGQTNIAREHFSRAYTILRARNDLYNLPSYYTNVAAFYEDIGKLDSALLMVDEGIKILNEIGNDDKIRSFRLIKAKLLLNSDMERAYRIAQEVRAPILGGKDKAQKSSLYQILYNCYKKKGNYELALEMNEQYLLYADSVLMDKNKTAIIREALQTEYNTRLFNNQLEAEKKETELKLKQLRLIYSVILIGVTIFVILFFYYRFRMKKNQIQQKFLLDEIERLKSSETSSISFTGNNFQLNRDRIEVHIDKKLNETDWKVLNILLDDPVIANKEIAEKAFMSIDGIGSSLRRMYEYFEIKESKYKKIALLLEAIKASNDPSISV